MTAIYIVAAILWGASGLASFIYWWTKDFDVTIASLFAPGIFPCMFLGPLAWLMAWLVHGTGSSWALIKKRKTTK